MLKTYWLGSSFYFTAAKPLGADTEAHELAWAEVMVEP